MIRGWFARALARLSPFTAFGSRFDLFEAGRQVGAARSQAEAQAFVARDAVAIPDRLSDLRRALASVIGRERVALQEIEFREGCPRPGCRPVGLEWAYDQLFLDAAALQQLDALLAALEPHEALVRVLLASLAPAPAQSA